MGLLDVQRNLAAAVARVEAGASRGVLAGVGVLKAETLPLTPLLTGELRGSVVTSEEMTAAGPVAAIAFTDPKAARVHEMPIKHPTTAGTGNKFLQRGMALAEQEALEAVYRECRIG